MFFLANLDFNSTTIEPYCNGNAGGPQKKRNNNNGGRRGGPPRGDYQSSGRYYPNNRNERFNQVRNYPNNERPRGPLLRINDGLPRKFDGQRQSIDAKAHLSCMQDYFDLHQLELLNFLGSIWKNCHFTDHHHTLLDLYQNIAESQF